jgi:hypothetical protein
VPNGIHKLHAVVSDPTPFVRNDPTNARYATNTWTLSLNLPVQPSLFIENVQMLPGQKLSLLVKGVAPQGFAVEVGADFQMWSSISTNVLVNGACFLTNNATGGRAFYRLRTPP